ncbi:MAG: ABC transporter substrate-binding protein [Geminicoccaceae bacterium]
MSNEIEWLKGALATGRIGRREFLGRTAALGIGATTATGWASSLRAEEPKKGGLLKLGMSGGSSTDSLDPRTYTDWVPGFTGYATFNLLVEIDDSSNATPELAESWEAKPGAQEWIFDIRKGVTFHNGKTLDADDVVYSLNLHRGPDVKSGAKGVIEAITDVKAVGKNQVAITLKEPNADLPYILSDYHLFIVPAGFTDWSKPIGTGAFILDRFDPGVGVSGNLNKNYWKQGRGHVDRFEVTVINDGTARLNALISGQVHIMNRVDRKTVDLLKRNPNLQIQRSSGGQHFTFLMLCDRKPLDDNNLRLALKYAIDREAILKTILHGYGKVGNDHPIPEHDPFFNKELPVRTYDPDKAKFYLKQAGLDGFSIELDTSEAAFTEAPDTAILFQQQAQKAGITVDVQRKPADGYWNDIWMKVPFSMSYWGGRPTADMMFSTAYKSDAAWNDTFWKRPEFDKLLLQARAITDPDQRRPLYWEMQRMVNEDGGNMIPMFADFVDALSAQVKGFTPSPVWELSGLRAAERCWLET